MEPIHHREGHAFLGFIGLATVGSPPRQGARCFLFLDNRVPQRGINRFAGLRALDIRIGAVLEQEFEHFVIAPFDRHMNRKSV